MPRWLFLGTVLLLTPLTILAEALVAPSGTLIAGASGLVAACIGLTLKLHPRARVTLYVLRLVTMPIWGYGVGWVLFQLALWSLGIDGIAWVAHLAGFAAGLGVGVLAREKKVAAVISR